MRKRYTAKKKAQIVLEILKEERSIAQIASECQLAGVNVPAVFGKSTPHAFGRMRHLHRDGDLQMRPGPQGKALFRSADLR
jgi:hypothetical protein